MTSYFAPTFFALFLPLSILAYALTPNRLKRYCLLIENCIFYWLVSGVLIVYLCVTTVSMYCFGLWLDGIQKNMKAAVDKADKESRREIKKTFAAKQRYAVLLAVILHIGVLLLLKYSGFFAENVNSLLGAVGASFVIEIPKFLVPVGISFFTLQALSYIFDVHNGTVKADRNILRLALFISFFPQIVEGPICRYNQTADQLWDVKPVTYHNLTWGLQRFLYGLMKKLVIADRLNPFVKHCFIDYETHDGGMAALAAICYTIQLYMDFSGSMDAVIGVAQIFGIEMPENFKRPFFSRTISEFWTRWHITLGTWFREYVFYPITTASCMKKLTTYMRRKAGNHYGPLAAGSIALFCVWYCNGLWHGPAWNYVFFGMYHFVLILTGSLIAPLAKTVNSRLHINTESVPYRVFQTVRTAVLVVVGEMFFRALRLRDGLKMFSLMVTDFSLGTINSDVLKMANTDYMEGIVALLALMIVVIVDVLNERGISVRERISKRHIAVRWVIFYALIIFIIVFGCFGVGYEAVDPLYAQF